MECNVWLELQWTNRSQPLLWRDGREAVDRSRPKVCKTFPRRLLFPKQSPPHLKIDSLPCPYLLFVSHSYKRWLQSVHK